MKKVIGLLNCHTSPEIGEFTASRPLTSSPFLGRYALCDFGLSNFCNSGIENIAILIRSHQRSVLKHMGSRMNWVSNTKIGKETILFNEHGILNPVYNTDLRNLRENDWILYESDADTIVFQSAHIITKLDFRPIVKEHRLRGEDITLVYADITSASSEFINENIVEVDEEGYVSSLRKNDRTQQKASVSLGAVVMSRACLKDMAARFEEFDSSYLLPDLLRWILAKGLYKIHTYKYEGYARCFDTLAHYVQYSFEFLDNNFASKFFDDDWPVYTVTRDTPPALYGKDATVKNSMVANGCVIEGKVRNSIICRDVTIGKGAEIRNSIVFSGTKIADGAKLSNVVIDKYSNVLPRHKIEGDEENFIYMKQGSVI